MRSIISRLRKTAFVTLFLPASLIAPCLFVIISASKPYDAELRFAENSNHVNVLGSILPASCESGGNDLAGPSHTSGCVWTSYCTPQYDPNPFQWWQYSNDDSVDYRYTGSSCAPNWQTYCTGPWGSPRWTYQQQGYDQGGGGPWYQSSPGTSCAPTVDVWP